eukprot:EG_transcript_7382
MGKKKGKGQGGEVQTATVEDSPPPEVPAAVENGPTAVKSKPKPKPKADVAAQANPSPTAKPADDGPNGAASPPAAPKKKAKQQAPAAAAPPPPAEPEEVPSPESQPKPKPKPKKPKNAEEPPPEPEPEPAAIQEDTAAEAEAEEEAVPAPVPAKAKEKPKALWTVEDHANVAKVIRFNFPVYGIHWFGSERLCIGGGGGQRYGMPNHLICAMLKKGKAGHFNFTVSAGYDSQQAIIWSLGTVHWTTKQVIVGHMDSISLLKLEYDKARVRKLASLPVLSKDQQESRKYAAVSPCGQLAIVAQDDCRLACVQVRDEQLFLRAEYLVGHEDRITDISVAAFPKELLPVADRGIEGGAAAFALVATAAEDRSLRLWRVLVAQKKGVKAVVPIGRVDTSAVRSDKCLFKFCRLDPTGRILYALSTGMGSPSYVTVFDLKPRREPPAGKKGDAGLTCSLVRRAHHKVTADSITALSLSHDGRILVGGDNEGVVYALRAADLQVVMRRKDLHDCPVTSIDISRNNELIASADLEATVKVYPLGGPSTFPLTAVVGALLVALLLLAAWLLLWR